MTEQQIIETLATKVMGWDKVYIEFMYPMWNPLQNIADAFQVAEKFDSYKVKKIQYMHVYSCVLRSELLGEALAGGKTAQEAICNAAYKLAG